MSLETIGSGSGQDCILRSSWLRNCSSLFYTFQCWSWGKRKTSSHRCLGQLKTTSLCKYLPRATSQRDHTGLFQFLPSNISPLEIFKILSPRGAFGPTRNLCECNSEAHGASISNFQPGCHTSPSKLAMFTPLSLYLFSQPTESGVYTESTKSLRVKDRRTTSKSVQPILFRYANVKTQEHGKVWHWWNLAGHAECWQVSSANWPLIVVYAVEVESHQRTLIAKLHKVAPCSALPFWYPRQQSNNLPLSTRHDFQQSSHWDPNDRLCPAGQTTCHPMSPIFPLWESHKLNCCFLVFTGFTGSMSICQYDSIGISQCPIMSHSHVYCLL